MKAMSIFVRNANPTATPARASLEVEPLSSAGQNAQADRRSKRVRKASGLLNRKISTATGVSAKTKAATNAAVSPFHRRTNR
jgi:hypothetical protein